MRADQLLVARGLASSRAQAQRIIASGVQWRVDTGGSAAWKAVAKNGDELPDDAELQMLDMAESRYVSRGGLKLEGALKDSALDVKGKLCLDVGQSTGGFTDCLLRHGAARVVGVDVGHGQLHAMLRSDPRVLCIEQVNARDVQAMRGVAAQAAGLVPADGQAAAAPAPVFDLVVGDLSFISQTLVLPAVVPLLKAGGDLLMLVKPQFELQPGQVGKHGIVKDAALLAEVEQRIRACCAGLGLQVLGWFDSTITGGEGSREFFIHALKK